MRRLTRTANLLLVIVPDAVQTPWWPANVVLALALGWLYYWIVQGERRRAREPMLVAVVATLALAAIAVARRRGMHSPRHRLSATLATASHFHVTPRWPKCDGSDTEVRNVATTASSGEVLAEYHARLPAVIAAVKLAQQPQG